MGNARQTLIDELRELALVLGEVTLTSGRTAQYYVDAKRAILLPTAFRAVGELVRAEAARAGATAVGGMTMGADPVACAALAAGFDGKAFFVRKDTKAHGLQRRIEGPDVDGRTVLVVEDVSTTGGSPLTAAEALQEAGAEVIAVAVIVDRGGREAVEKAGFEYRAAFELADLGLS